MVCCSTALHVPVQSAGLQCYSVKIIASLFTSLITENQSLSEPCSIIGLSHPPSQTQTTNQSCIRLATTDTGRPPASLAATLSKMSHTHAAVLAEASTKSMFWLQAQQHTRQGSRRSCTSWTRCLTLSTMPTSMGKGEAMQGSQTFASWHDGLMVRIPAVSLHSG